MFLLEKARDAGWVVSTGGKDRTLVPTVVFAGSKAACLAYLDREMAEDRGADVVISTGPAGSIPIEDSRKGGAA